MTTLRSQISVSYAPGSTSDTRMPSEYVSMRSDSLQPSSAYFDALYALSPGWPRRPAIEVTVMMCPDFLRAHERQHGLGHGDVAKEISLELMAKLSQSHVLGETRHAESGIVDQHIDTPMIVDGRLRRERQGVEFGNVEPPQIEAVVNAGRLRRLFQPATVGEIAHRRHHPVAIQRQLDSSQQPNSAGTSGDTCIFSSAIARRQIPQIAAQGTNAPFRASSIAMPAAVTRR